MDRCHIEGAVFPEKRDPLRLEKVSADGVDGYRIGSHNQSLIGPDISSVKEIGSSPVELGREGAEDIEPGLSLHDGIRPDLAQR